MNDQTLNNPHLLRTEEVRMEEMGMARRWICRKEETLCWQLFAAQEDLFFMMARGPTLNNPNRKRTVCLGNGMEYPNGTFKGAMGLVQLHNILGRRNNCHTMEIRKRVAKRELTDGAWMNVFNALCFDGLVPNNNQAATFFADWAA